MVGGGSSALRAGSTVRKRNRLQSVKDQATGFATVNLFIGITAKLLQSVWQATAAALTIPGFGEASAMMPLGDARIKLAQILGNRSQSTFVLGKQRFELFLLLGLQGFDLFSLFRDRCLVFPEIRFRVPHA